MPSLWKAAQEALSPIFRPAGITVDGIKPGDWASPQNPIRPTARLGTGVRSWDFTPGLNLQFTPRGDTAVTFQQLYNVSNSFDPCRLMIETRKNQVANRAWTIRVKTVPGETKKQRLQRNASDQDVAAVTQLLMQPDGHHSFRLWMKMWMEQLLVYDAPAVYPVRNLMGDVMGFRVISGSTITPLVDEQGFIPQPPSPAYQQIILGIPTSNLTAVATKDKPKLLTADELIYFPYNPRVNSRWGYSPVEQIITTLSIASNRQQFLLDYYKSGNVPEGLQPLPENWTMQQIKDFQQWFDGMLVGNLAKKRRLIMVPDTKHPAQFSKEKALTDGTDEYLIRVVAFAFDVPIQNLIKQAGHQSTAKEGNDTSLEQGLEPILKHVEDFWNLVITKVLNRPNVEFAYEDAREVDPLKQSQVDVAYVNAGIYTRDEVRETRGDDPLGVPQGSIPGITTAQGFVPLTQAVGQTDPEDPDDEQPTPTRSSSKVGKSAAALKLTSILTPQVRKLRGDAESVIARFLSDQLKRVVSDVVAAYKKHSKVKKGDTETDTDRALAIMAAIRWDYDILYGQLSPILEDAAEDGASAGVYQMAASGKSGLKSVAEAKAEAGEWGLARTAELVGAKMVDGKLTTDEAAQWAISDTAKAEVENTVRMAIVEAWTPTQLQAVLEASALFTKEHADLIADVEVKRAQTTGHYVGWSSTKRVAEVAWRVSPGHEKNDICDHYAAKGSVPIGHEYARGVIAPPDAHPNCECWLEITKFKEDED